MPQNPKATESTLGVLKARGSVAYGFYHWKELNDKLDDEFMTWLQQIMKCSPDEFKKREFDKVQTVIDKVFDEMGLDDDPWEDEDGDEDNLDGKRPERNAADRKMGASSDSDAPPKTANATHWQEAQEEKRRLTEEMRSKDLSSLYKQLAKLLHPDLEQDPEMT